MFGNNGPFSYSPRGFSQEDLPQQRRAFQQDDFKGAPLQGNNMSRPSGKSIYMQRKEYSEVLNKHPDNFQVRVEHLFTCELDGQEVKTIDDCLAKLKRLDAKSRLWPQEMIMEVQGGYLLLSDIETKAELESLPLSCILQTKAVLDSCAYNSLLTVTVQQHNKHIPQVFMFQCEETGAGVVKSDLDKAAQKGGDVVEPRRDQSDIRSNLENIIGQHVPGGLRQAGPRPVQRERTPPPPDHPPPQWRSREPENMPSPPFLPPQEATMHHSDLHESQSSPDVAEQMNMKRNTDILNHVINDLEIFMAKVSAAANASSLPQKDKSKNKHAFGKKKSKKNAPAAADSLPPWEEYVSCLQKIKYGFNLLGQLDGTLTSPTAADFVHIFFTSLGMILPQYPADLPPTVFSPLLTETALRLLTQVVDPEEDQLWRSLGDCWNFPRSRWPDDNVPLYIPEFYDGWQPPSPSHTPSPLLSRDGPMRKSQSLPAGPRKTPLYMRVIYNFVARNNRELSIMKGDVVQVVQKSKQWWLVRNALNEEGNVPQNVLEHMESDGPVEDLPRNTPGPVTLDMSSPPAEVKAWLEYKGFSKITVTSLGVLTGKLLLGMTKDEIRTVCPEEGGKVFFQLQAIKSAIALASEPSGRYNGHY
ncbi:epidermal growth factor receptor kinase substrate 8-like protein 3b [Etheostoma cragini]|uniref:epidermal growth factor receptor kinase substrate 8-like protein 3b n=1 Tax=Etheostoma cragini TaxID=417921 RepID=UPI00155E0312|nr:epidermal growth factor receptor kinase substrate 8-like protein 3b [Etheostoma cragini]XP_034732796.1 epidermal growth factor receptor kinase substrate 8-like protein 3b [Etheostoma cragini]